MERSRYAIKSIYPDPEGNARPGHFIEFGVPCKSVAKSLQPGDKMLIYVTGTRKVLGAVEVANVRQPYSELRHGRFRHRVRCRWLINVHRSRGVKPSTLGLPMMSRQYRAYQPITSEQFAEAIAALLRRAGRDLQLAA
jgi:hypothetical protein